MWRQGEFQHNCNRKEKGLVHFWNTHYCFTHEEILVWSKSYLHSKDKSCLYSWNQVVPKWYLSHCLKRSFVKSSIWNSSPRNDVMICQILRSNSRIFPLVICSRNYPKTVLNPQCSFSGVLGDFPLKDLLSNIFKVCSMCHRLMINFVTFLDPENYCLKAETLKTEPAYAPKSFLKYPMTVLSRKT